MAARRGRLEAILEPLQGEIIACIQGVQAAIDAGVVQVIVETDALAVVQAINSSSVDLSAMANLLSELRSLLSLNFNSWRVQHRPRESNKALLVLWTMILFFRLSLWEFSL